MSDDNESAPPTIQQTMFLQERDQVVDDTLISVVGPAIVTFLVRVIKVSKMFTGDHAQVNTAANEFTIWISEQFDATREEAISIQMSEKNFFINGQLLKLDARAFHRALEIRKGFLEYSINSITMKRGIAAGEIVALVQALRDLRTGELPTLELFQQPNLELASVVEQDYEVPDVDERRQLIELYAGLLVKCHIYFSRLKRGATPSARHVKRLVQRIANELEERGDVFVGLINLKLIAGQEFVHAVNTCIYAMLLAHAVGLERTDIVRCGMTAMTQNIERLSDPLREESEFRAGDDTHFDTNLSSMVALSAIGAGDVLSALRLVTSYERGFPFNKPLPEAWYREELRPHLLSRVIEIARHYDILTQGLEGANAKTPDRSLQTMMAKMGSHYDPNLTRIFVNVVGVYPVGCIVELSTSDRALIIRSPALTSDQNLSNAGRPVIKLMDGSDRIMDLSQQQHAGLRILRIVDRDEVEDAPGAFFLF